MSRPGDLDAQWRELATCAEQSLESPMIAAGWTNENDPAEEPARYVCKKVCPVRAICLGDAIHDPDSFGMRGGFFFIKGKVTYREGREIEKEFGMTPNTRQKPREFKETLPTDG